MALVRTGMWTRWALVGFVALAASVASGPVLADNAFAGAPGVADGRKIDRDIRVYLAQAKSDDLLLMEPTPATPAPAGKGLWGRWGFCMHLSALGPTVPHSATAPTTQSVPLSDISVFSIMTRPSSYWRSGGASRPILLGRLRSRSAPDCNLHSVIVLLCSLTGLSRVRRGAPKGPAFAQN